MNRKLIFFAAGIVLLFFGLNKSGYSQHQNSEIEKIRKGKLIIEGTPGTDVEINQTKHEFWFGCALSSGMFQENSRYSDSDKNRYKQKFLENFNAAVTENAVKWASMEPVRGTIDYQTPDNILAWTEKNNIPCRGHNLFWGIDKFVQPWVKELSDVELRKAIKKRGVETASHFKGRFYEFDLNNEMIHGNYYEKRLGEGITKNMAKWVLRGDKNARLWLNDYDILTGNKLAAFLAHIRKLQKNGVPVSGLGVQGHLHGNSFSRESLKTALDSLAQFNLPIRITEFNLPGQRSDYYKNRGRELTPEQEVQKARDIVDYYTICFAHPAVEGILMWGFWAGANWIPQSSLYKKDWSETPALKAYQNLIFNTWWTSEKVILDKNGRAEIPAFYGNYEIKWGANEKRVSLKRMEKTLKVKLN